MAVPDRSSPMPVEAVGLTKSLGRGDSRVPVLRGLDLVLEADNVVMTRTFSKIHGLAALRIGQGLALGGAWDGLASLLAIGYRDSTSIPYWPG